MEHIDHNIIDVDIEKEVKKSFMEYAVSVIISRALPDVRDGLKPVHRRILYTMYETGLTPDKAYKKSVAAVGDVLGKFHPHGEASVYDAMTRMVQRFTYRYPLIDGQGNFGSIDGDPPAAYRYTEARLQRMSMEMLRDIERDTVDFMPNFDGTRTEPTVLPSRFPNLLVNGGSGIAVGMATNLAPHNLNEVIDAAVYMLDHPDASLDALMAFIPGPDFPTGGIIMGRAGIRAAYATGRGHIKMRAKTEIEEKENGRSRIIVSEIPYLVNKAKMIEKIAELVKEKRIDGITNITDESSSRTGMRVVIDLARTANAHVVLNRLFQYSPMQSTFAVNALALDGTTPRVMTLHDLLTHYVAHQRRIIVRRTEYDMKKALQRAHILQGLRLAVDNIDEVIRIIRASSSVPEAKAALMERFTGADVANLLRRAGEAEDGLDYAAGLSDEQASAIVAMTLGQLTGLAVEKIENEYAERVALIRACREILGDPARVSGIVRDELTEIKKRFGDERRTHIEAVEDELDIEDLIKEETCVYTLTRRGYIKRIPAEAYRVQRRGGKGVTGMQIREEDVADTLFVAGTHDHILFFTSAGRVFRMKGYNIPEAGRNARGVNIVNLLQLEAEERVTAMLHGSDADREDALDNLSLCMVTRQGFVKRMEAGELRNIRRSGLRALSLREGDELIRVFQTGADDEVLIGTKFGRCVRFPVRQARTMGRTASGVIGIRLAEGDCVVGAAAAAPAPSDGYVLTVTALGYGKMTPLDEFPAKSRATQGVILHNRTEKTGDVAGMIVTDGLGDLFLITDDGMMIRTGSETLRICGRGSQGVIVMRTKEGEQIIGLAEAPKEDADDDSAFDKMIENETESDEEEANIDNIDEN